MQLPSDMVFKWTHRQNLAVSDTQRMTCNNLALQIPVQQMAWLLSDQACRVVVCGKGTAGAVAQQITLQLQQQLTSLLPDQVTNRRASHTILFA